MARRADHPVARAAPPTPRRRASAGLVGARAGLAAPEGVVGLSGSEPLPERLPVRVELGLGPAPSRRSWR